MVVLFFLDRKFRVLPSAIHEYMPMHHHGLVLTDITITTCTSVNPFSSCQLDPNVWHRIEKDLYLGNGVLSSAFLHVRRMREEDLTADDRVVVDVTVGRLNPSAAEKAREGEQWESRPMGLWVKRSARRHASDSKDAVTGIDLLFGEDAVEARDGWLFPGGTEAPYQSSYSVMGVWCIQLAENEIRELQQEVLNSIIDGFRSNV